MADSVTVLVRFWAGARRAAGHDEETLSAATVAHVRDLLAARPELTKICAVASFLVDGQQAAPDAPLRAGAEVDVLPPFAGGAPSDSDTPADGAPLIVGIGGSTSAVSTTGRMLDLCLAEVAAAGARTERIVGAELAGLPIYTGGGVHPRAHRLVETVRAADCVVIATPGYHGGMSGLVKNAIDHLEELRDDARPYLTDRAVGVIVTAAGWQACGTTLVSVRSTIHALRGWPTPLGVTVNSAEQLSEDDSVVGAVRVLAGQLIQFAAWQRALRAPAR